MSRPPRLDTAGMWEAAVALPEQLSGALETAQRVFGPPSAAAGPAVRAVVAFGLGTSATACEAAAALVAPHLAVPFVVARSAGVPAAVGPGCLVLVASCGADAPETVDAAAEALARGARVVGVGSDGALARFAADAGIAWCPAGSPGPAGRAALGAATVSLLSALHREGLAPDPGPSVTAAATALQRRRDAFVAEKGAASELARKVGRTIPLVYGSGIGAVAARRWKACVNVNAKAPAFAAEVPALAYDELAGWGQGGDVTRQTMTLVLLRHAGEAAPAPAQFAVVRNATEEVMADILEVWADGDDDLGRFFDLALLGDLVSLEMAAREGVDPGPVPAVDEVLTLRP